MSTILYSERPEELTAAADGALLLDLSPREQYLAQRLPGAVHMQAHLLRTGVAPATGMVPPLGQLAEAFAEAGVNGDTRVIAYGGEMEKDACRAVWSLHLLGHRNAQWLAGGRAHWQRLGLPLEDGEPTASAASAASTRGSFAPQPDERLHRDCEQIMQSLGQMQIWDCRSRDEYRGTEVRTERGGHIPGAFHLDWLDLLDSDNLPLPRDEVRARLQRAGCNLDEPVTTHCQLHMRSSVAWVIGRDAGLDISAYSGSWSEWGNRTDTPIER